MEAFGETIRNLRNAQKRSLREVAARVGISPAYLSRIEHGKEAPPSPEVILELCKSLNAEPDALFPLTHKADPDIVKFINEQPLMLRLIRYLKLAKFSETEIKEVLRFAEKLKA
ncbi:MAG: helix-turn-helix domain-containing protein [Endomicrobium sp.]|jgi:transcriptional regulator with XRE-family HTH domain|nr:helix-turn-helix domain-containing protein [Endomicrobium sp.]